MKTNKKPRTRKANVDRRAFVKLLPALGAAGLAATKLPLDVLAQTPTPSPVPSPSPSPTPPPRITKEMMHQAEKLIGIEFTDAQEAMALGGVNRNLDAYEANRKVDVPLDTEPAIAFHPTRAKKELYAPKTKFRFGKVEPAQFNNVEDLAFATVPQFAELIRTRRITSTDLTKMYLARLKKYGPKLLCVVTLTEDLALKQAAAADAEIKRGKYRGPLHGIPWGAKDLFATKGIKTTWGAEPYRDQVIDYDSTVVERLNEAGAVLVAKVVDGRTRTRPALVCWCDTKSLAARRSANRIERLVGWSSRSDCGWPRRVLDRHGDARLDCFAFFKMRRHGAASDVWPRESSRSDGFELDDGQDRSDVSGRRGLCRRIACDLWS